MLNNHRLLFYVLMSFVLMLGDCRCYRRKITIKSVVLEIPTSVTGFSEDLAREKFSTLVKQIIEKNPHFHFDANAEDEAILRLTLIPPGESEKSSSIMLGATLSPSQEGAKEYKSFADITMVNGGIRGSDVSLGLDKALENLHQLYSGRSADNETYLEKIHASVRGELLPQGDVLNAISVLGGAQEKRAVEPLIQLLSKTTELSVGNALVIALGEMGAKKAMPAIIDFSERKPAIIRRQAIIAARHIGSKLAAEWLLVMAYGHDDPVVRKEATLALEAVEEKLTLKN